MRRALLVVKTRSVIEASPLESALEDDGFEVVVLMYERLAEAKGRFDFAAMFGLGDTDERPGFEAAGWVRVVVGDTAPFLVIGGWNPATRDIATRLKGDYNAEYYRRGSPTNIIAKARFMLGLTQTAPPATT